MPRPKIPRKICSRPANSCFKPNGIPMAQLQSVEMAEDEFEAMRLVDLEGFQQQQAAVEMEVSRQTLANLVKSARFKVAECLVQGKALKIKELADDHCNTHD